MRKYSFTVPGKIIPKERPRRVFAPSLKAHHFPYTIDSRAHHEKMMITFTPKTTRDYQKLVASYAQRAGVTMMEYCKVDCLICLPKTKKNTIPLNRVDRDNAYGNVLDGLQGVAYENDRDAIDGTPKYKFTDHGTEQRMEVTITEVDPENYIESSLFNIDAEKAHHALTGE